VLLEDYPLKRSGKPKRRCGSCDEKRAAYLIKHKVALRELKDMLGLKPADFKECRICLETKPGSEFAPNALSRDGLATYCRECFNATYQPGKRSQSPPVYDAPDYERVRLPEPDF
jgi:hypothetical protein